MIRIFLLIFLFASSFHSFAQKRQLTKAIDEINEGNFTESYQRLLQVEKSEGKIPELLFTRYIYHKSIKRSLNDLDSAYEALKAAFDVLEKIEPKDKEKLCKDFQFCDPLKEKYFEDMERLLFTSYTAGFSKSTILEYKKKYSDSKWVMTADHLIDSLDYAGVKNSTNIKDLKDYISLHPQSSFNGEVEQLIYKNAFGSAKGSGDIDHLKKFIQEYAQAPQLNEAQALLEEWEWKKADKEGTVKSYTNFITAYANSKYAAEAIKKIEQIEWSETEKLNTSSGYKSFIAKYPNSAFVKEATRRFEEMRVNVFPFMTAEKKYMLFDIDKNAFRTQEVYETLELIGKGKFIASKYKKFGLIDKNGDPIIPLTYNCISIYEGLCELKLGNKLAVYTINGEKVIDFQYDQFNIDKNIIIATKYGKTDTARKQFDIYDKRGNVNFSGQYHSLYTINDTLFNVTLNNSQFLVNSSSKIVSNKYQSIQPPMNDLMVVSIGQKYGLINTAGKVILPVQYEYLVSEDSSRYFIAKNKLGQKALFNSSGQFLINFQAKEITGVGEGMFLLQTELNTGTETADGILYNARKSAYVANERYSWVNYFSNGFALAGKLGKSGYIDVNGKWVVPPIYDEDMRYYGEGDGHDGYDGAELDEDTGEEPVSCYPYARMNDTEEYSSYYGYSGFSLNFYDGLAMVEIEGQYGYVNTNGELKIPIIYNFAENFDHGYANVRIIEQGESVNQVINLNGKVILNNARLINFFDKNRKALLLQGDQYAILDLATDDIRKLDLKTGYEYLTPMPDYFKTSFKGKTVYVHSSGLELMDPDADFSVYDFNQQVIKLNELFYSGKTDEAISGYLDLLDQKPESYAVNLMLSRCYEEKKDDYNFNRYLDKAIEIKPNNVDLLSKRAEHNYENKNWSAAINDLSKLITLASTFYPDYYFKRAYSNAQIGYNEKALDDYNMVILNTKTYPMAYNNRGVIYMNRNLYAQALSDFSNAIINGDKSDNENMGLYYSNKGNALYNLNRKPEACASWNKALSLGRSSVSSMISRYCSGGK